MEANVKIIGHQLVTVKEKGVPEADEHDMLRVSFRGIGDDSKTRGHIMVDPEHARDYPLGDKGVLTFEIRQQKLELEGKGRGRAAAS